MRKVRLLETRDAAKELGLSPRTLEGWRRRREGPPYLKIGRRVKYRPEESRRTRPLGCTEQGALLRAYLRAPTVTVFGFRILLR